MYSSIKCSLNMDGWIWMEYGWIYRKMIIQK